MFMHFYNNKKESLFRAREAVLYLLYPQSHNAVITPHILSFLFLQNKQKNKSHLAHYYPIPQIYFPSWVQI